MKEIVIEKEKQTELGKIWAFRLQKALPVFFRLCFFLYYSLLSTPYFTDEEDAFFGAYNVIKGQDIYRSFVPL